jgi:tellurite resistance protein TerC
VASELSAVCSAGIEFVLLAESSDSFEHLAVPGWAWPAALGVIAVLLLVDILVLHRRPHAPTMRRAAFETAAWVAVGVAFGVVVLVGLGARGGGEWFSVYLVEYSLSIDNVFVWAMILTYFVVPLRYQHRVLFWGVFGALVLRAGFIFAGVALIERFDWVMYLFGAFLVYTAVRLVISDDDQVDPADSRFLKVVRRMVPLSDRMDGQHLFTRVDGKRVATPLFAVLLLVEATDVLFAVDSVPAVLAVSRSTFIVFTSNAFAIMGLRSLYFLLADMRARFSNLQQGLAIILAFVGVKMIIHRWADIPTWMSLLVIGLVLAASIGFSVRERRGADTITLPPDSTDGGAPDER